MKFKLTNCFEPIIPRHLSDLSLRFSSQSAVGRPPLGEQRLRHAQAGECQDDDGRGQGAAALVGTGLLIVSGADERITDSLVVVVVVDPWRHWRANLWILSLI